MAAQLLALVTVNGPLSEAVGVFYGVRWCRDPVRVHTCGATDSPRLTSYGKH